jgi:hypothetical protein
VSTRKEATRPEAGQNLIVFTIRYGRHKNILNAGIPTALSGSP